MEKLTTTAEACASLTRRGDDAEHMDMWGVYQVECYDREGNLKWIDTYRNLVTNQGKTDNLTQYFKGATYTAAFYLGLVDGATTPTFNASDTAASHTGWTENQSYSNTTRVSAVFGTPSASGGGAGSAGTGTVVTSAAVFNINASATMAGTFLTTSNTKGGTAGVLFSAGAFTGGNRTVVNGDTLNVTYTANN